MNKIQRPIRLDENVIVDAVFEIRFSAAQEFSDLVPGSARQLFTGVSHLQKTPLAELPLHIRSIDPSLQYQPTMRMVWEDIVLVIGDNTLGLGYGTKYPGWNTFKNHIEALFQWLEDSNLVDMIMSVERYAFKYIDFIPQAIYSGINDPFTVNINLGSEVKNSNFKLQLEQNTDFGVSLFEYANPVTAEIDDKPLGEGAMISVDTVRILPSSLIWSNFIKDYREYSENMHFTNKESFFNALSEETISKLGPIYE